VVREREAQPQSKGPLVCLPCHRPGEAFLSPPIFVYSPDARVFCDHATGISPPSSRLNAENNTPRSAALPPECNDLYNLRPKFFPGSPLLIPVVRVQGNRIHLC